MYIIPDVYTAYEVPYKSNQLNKTHYLSSMCTYTVCNVPYTTNIQYLRYIWRLIHKVYTIPHVYTAYQVPYKSNRIQKKKTYLISVCVCVCANILTIWSQDFFFSHITFIKSHLDIPRTRIFFTYMRSNSNWKTRFVQIRRTCNSKGTHAKFSYWRTPSFHVYEYVFWHPLIVVWGGSFKL